LKKVVTLSHEKSLNKKCSDLPLFSHCGGDATRSFV